MKIQAHTPDTGCLEVLHVNNKTAIIKHIRPDEVALELTELANISCKCLILETYESPYHVVNPHLELRLLLK